MLDARAKKTVFTVSENAQYYLKPSMKLFLLHVDVCFTPSALFKFCLRPFELPFNSLGTI